MPSVLTVIAVVGVLILVLMGLFILQVTVSPRLLMGTLSEPIPLKCNVTSQWLIYECRRNPLTGLGCVIPDSGGRFITAKDIAVELPSCLPNSHSQIPGQRIVSYAWAEKEAIKPCKTTGSATATCCTFTSQCSQTAEYICRATGAGLGGENQCLPSFLPAPFPPPGFNPKTDYTTIPVVLEIPCRTNYCQS